MSIWDTLAAFTADPSVLGSIGALRGGEGRHHDPDTDALPFTVGMISLGAKMAKADGVVTKDEVHAFKKAFKISDAELKHAARAFNLAKQDVAGYDTCADELATALRGDRKMLEYVLEGLFHIAKVDDVLHPQEEQFLKQVAKRFCFTECRVRLHEGSPYYRS